MCAQEQCGLIERRILFDNTKHRFFLIRSDPCLSVLASRREVVSASRPLCPHFFTSDSCSTFLTREDLTRYSWPEISSSHTTSAFGRSSEVPQAAIPTTSGLWRVSHVEDQFLARLQLFWHTLLLCLPLLVYESSKVIQVFQESTDESRRRCLPLFERQSSKHHCSHGFACTCPLLLWVCFFSQPFLCPELLPNLHR